MKTTTGIAIVANAVISKQGMDLRFHDGDRKFCIYESPSDSLAVVRVLDSVPNYNHTRHSVKAIYLYNARDFGTDFSNYGGIQDAKVCVDHPRGAQIIDTIDRIGYEFRSITLPKGVVDSLTKSKPDWRKPLTSELRALRSERLIYSPLENWARIFAKEFPLPEYESSS